MWPRDGTELQRSCSTLRDTAKLASFMCKLESMLTFVTAAICYYAGACYITHLGHPSVPSCTNTLLEVENRSCRKTIISVGCQCSVQKVNGQGHWTSNTSRVVDQVPNGSSTDCKLGLIIIRANLLSTREMLCNRMNGWPHVM